MHADDRLGSSNAVDQSDLPTIDDTIAAMTILGRILDELRTRLATAERTVASLQKEKLALRVELRAIVECVARRPTPTAPVRPVSHLSRETPLDDALLALIQGVDQSFGRAAARH